MGNTYKAMLNLLLLSKITKVSTLICTKTIGKIRIQIKRT